MLTSFELLPTSPWIQHPPRHRHPRSASEQVSLYVLMELRRRATTPAPRWNRSWQGHGRRHRRRRRDRANLSQRAAFWKLRDEMSAAQKPEGGSIKHDIRCRGGGARFIKQAMPRRKTDPGCRLCRSAISATAISTTMSAAGRRRGCGFPWPLHEVNAVVFEIVLKMADRSPPNTASACSSATNCPR